MSLRAYTEAQIEVHKFYGGAVVGIAILSIALQAFIHRFGYWGESLDIPLLVTIYFGLSRRNPATGLILGTFIGLLEDAVSHQALGLYGIAKTVIGYLASSIGVRLDTEHPLSRAFVVFAFFHLHHAVWVLSQRLLMDQAQPLMTTKLLIFSLVNAAIAPFLFPVLDLLRKPS